MPFVNELVTLIQSKSLDNVFNPYADVCKTFDKSDAIEIRLNNLRSYLTQMEKIQPKIIWIGESLGYKGGRRTGLPFTDDTHIRILSKIYNIPNLKIACNLIMSEMTASQVWKFIDTLADNKLPFLWNIFPYHPYRYDNQFTNRQLNSSELAEVQEIILLLLDGFNFDSILSIGRKSHNILNQIGISTTYIRHPSHGGAKIFRNRLESIYY